MKLSANDIVLKVLGLLLLVAAGFSLIKVPPYDKGVYKGAKFLHKARLPPDRKWFTTTTSMLIDDN